MAVPSRIINGRPVAPSAKILVERFKKLSVGEVVTYAECGQLINESKGTGRFQSVLTRARKDFFRETGVHLRTLSTVGLMFPEGAEQMKMGATRTRRAVRNIRRGMQIVAAVSDDRLTEPERKARDYAVDRARQLFEYANESGRIIHLSVGKPATLPPIPKS